LNEGVSTDLLDEVLTEVRVNQEVLRNRRNQPEFTMDYSRYREIFINSEMIENGRKKLERHDKLLNDLTDRYGVPSEVLVAIWGVESRYGTHENEFDVLNSLYTLAFASPEESRYFKGELLATLKGLDQEIIPKSRPKGSWAGAMGDPQFMPSSYLTYAVDRDGDGQKDIWESPEDILGSIANYLSEHGWDSSRPWGDQITSPDDRSDSGELLEPEGSQRRFRITDNFDVLLNYNRSEHYALVVGELTNALANRVESTEREREGTTAKSSR
jgi:membrane-bound lytic murein transglycosylase B